MSIFDDEKAGRFLPEHISQEIRDHIRIVLVKHGVIDETLLENDLVDTMKIGVSYYRDSLKAVSVDLLGVDRYRNMKCFPVVVDIVKKAANKSSQMLGYREPYPDHYSSKEEK